MRKATLESIRDTTQRRAWEQSDPEYRKLKLKAYRTGESLGDDIPERERNRVDRNRVYKKTALVLLLTGFVLVAG